jgi:hypothetical protein
MRKLFCCALIILPLIVSQEKDSSLKEGLRAKLEVETSVIEASTCIDNSGFDAKGSGTIGGQTIYHSPRNGNASLVEYEMNLTWMVMSENPRREGDVPSGSFIILQPQERYQGKAQTRLLIDYPERYEHFSSEVHYLRFGMWTTNGILHEANNVNDLRVKWKAIGYLWTEGVTTEPMEMRFPELGSIKKCQ